MTTSDDRTPDPPENSENGPGSDDEPPEGPEDHPDPDRASRSESEDEPDENADTFPRSYVEKMRRESQGYRERAKKGETALTRLVDATMREATSGVLIDSSDLSYDEDTMTDDDGFPDPEKIKQAAEELVGRKPHLAPRRPRGDIGQGRTPQNEGFSLAGVLRSNAG